MQHRVEFYPSVSPGESPITFASNAELHLSPDVVGAVSLLPALRLGVPLPCDGLSPGMLNSFQKIMHVFHSWVPDQFRVIEMTGLECPHPPRTVPGRTNAVFFSGGVDSFYGLLKNSP